MFTGKMPTQRGFNRQWLISLKPWGIWGFMHSGADNCRAAVRPLPCSKSKWQSDSSTFFWQVAQIRSGGRVGPNAHLRHLKLVWICAPHSAQQGGCSCEPYRPIYDPHDKIDPREMSFRLHEGSHPKGESDTGLVPAADVSGVAVCGGWGSVCKYHIVLASPRLFTGSWRIIDAAEPYNGVLDTKKLSPRLVEFCDHEVIWGDCSIRNEPIHCHIQVISMRQNIRIERRTGHSWRCSICLC